MEKCLHGDLLRRTVSEGVIRGPRQLASQCVAPVIDKCQTRMGLGNDDVSSCHGRWSTTFHWQLRITKSLLYCLAADV